MLSVRRAFHRSQSAAAERLLRSSWVDMVGDDRAFELRLAAARRLLRAEAGQRRADGTVPGQRLLDAVPDAIARIADRLPNGTVQISGTNGKTTTTSLIAAIVAAAGIAPVSNRIGANQPGGVAGELVAASRPGARLAGDCGVFEVDELWLDRVMEQLRPRALVLTNLFRDQLDRSAELEIVAERWAKALANASPDTQLVLCADDPRVAPLGQDRPGGVYFGLEDASAGLAGLPHAADPAYCGACCRHHDYGVVYLAHLGDWHCSGCGASRPNPDVFATDIHSFGMQGSSFVLHTPVGSAPVTLRMPGLYNVYNALAATASAYVMGVPIADVAATLECAPAVFGRAEVVEVGTRRLVLLLAKNPAGMNEVLRTLVHGGSGAPLDLVLLLNDRVYDGRDVSWIWDADFEIVAAQTSRAICAGTRAADMALRLKYAGVASSALTVSGSIAGALDDALASESPVFVLANYTAMLDARDVLVERGHLATVWR